MGACLGDDTLAAVLEGALTDEDARQAREHLAACDACRRLVSAIVKDPPATVDATRAPPSLGQTVLQTVVPGALLGGKYRVERLLGAGGMGQVFAARQLNLDRPVAIKVLKPGLAHDAVALSRFTREARLASSLVSDNVVRIHELGQLASGEPYLVMELLEGDDLGTIVERGPVPVDRALAWIVSACEAVGEAHALGIVHRDIKPQNLYVARVAGGDRLKVLDFGLAKLAAGDGGVALTADGVTLGSPRYMAPEQIMGTSPVDARSDVWALGATLHHLLAGAPPFTGESVHQILANVRDRAAPSLRSLRPEIGAPLASIVERCLAKDPAQRYASASELAAALRTIPAADQPSLLAGRYELCEQLGAGGHGIVFRAIQRPLGREVAVKILRREAHADPRLRERFVREAAILQRLEHPNTVRLYDAGVAEDGAPFLVFELVRGRSLEAEIGGRPMPVGRVVRIATQLLKALMEAHAQGIVHRDIKPANVLIVHHAGEVDFVKLLDFGVARPESGGAALTADGAIVGTPRYMAPEQLRGGSVDPRCDLYALGLVMAEALTGAPVYTADSAMAIYTAKISPAPTPLPPMLLASPLGHAIARATQHDPAARFSSATEMLRALDSSAPFSDPSAPTAAGPMLTLGTARPPPPPRGATGLIVALVVGVLAIVGIGVVAAVFVFRSAASFAGSGPAPAVGTDNGVLTNVDEARLRARLDRRGVKVGEITRQDFGTGCRFLQLEVGKGAQRGFHVYLFDCSSRGLAANEATRLRKGASSWTVAAGSRVLNCDLGDEVSSRDLCDALVDPPAPR